MGNPKHVFRLQLVHSICWEADPGLGEAKHLLSTPGKSGIEKIRFHLYHGTREEPTAGRLPCHHTSLWQLWAGADLIRKEQATLSRLLSQALGPDSEWRSLNPNSLKELGTRELPDLESSQIDAAVSELEWMFSELEAEKRRFFADVAWCLGARSSSRIVELGWPSIDSTSVPGYLEFQYRPSAQPWRREEIDPSRYIPDANAPFSAALLGEAWQALEHSDRSALVIMHIAAETATKECLASIVTGANHILYHRAECLTHVGDSQAVRSLTQCGEPMRFAMAAPIDLRNDFDSVSLRRLAKRTRDATQSRRLLALAEVYDGGSRTDASRIGGVGLQIIRDWVLRFNARGPDGLVDGKSPGAPSKLNADHRRALAEVVEAGPVPAVDGVVRWRRKDLARWLLETFAISLDETTVGRELKALGFAKISARPRHYAQNELAVEALKKTSPPNWRRSGRGSRKASR